MEKLTKDFEQNGGKWKNFKIAELFDIKTPKRKFNANSIKFGTKYPYVVRSSFNNGIRAYLDEDEKYLNPGNTISFGQDTATMFYQERPYFTGDKIKILSFNKKELNPKLSCYLLAVMRKAFSIFKWGSSSFNESVIKNVEIILPVDSNEHIAFNFIEERIRELEEERIRELTAYLKVSGLEDYNLTEQEQNAINLINNDKIKFEEFKLIDILDWQSQKEIDPLKINYLTVHNQPKYPFYGQATINNGVISYESLDKNVLNNSEGKPTILIHSNNQNCVYLETPFYLKDGHGATSVLQNEYINELNAHFIITCIKKVITEKFSYNEKATKIALKNTIIKLPISKKNQIDYNFMNTYIKAIEKLVIKKVVLWRDKVINKTKEVVNS